MTIFASYLIRFKPDNSLSEGLILHLTVIAADSFIHDYFLVRFVFINRGVAATLTVIFSGFVIGVLNSFGRFPVELCAHIITVKLLRILLALRVKRLI